MFKHVDALRFFTSETKVSKSVATHLIKQNHQLQPDLLENGSSQKRGKVLQEQWRDKNTLLTINEHNIWNITEFHIFAPKDCD